MRSEIVQSFHYRRYTEEEKIQIVARLLDGEDMEKVSDETRVRSGELQMWRKSYGHLATKKALRLRNKKDELKPIEDELPFVFKKRSAPTAVPDFVAEQHKPEEIPASDESDDSKARIMTSKENRLWAVIEVMFNGAKHKDVAEILGVPENYISRWKAAHKEEASIQHEMQKTRESYEPKETEMAVEPVIAPRPKPVFQTSTAVDPRDAEIKRLKQVIGNLTVELMTLKGEL